MTVPAELIERYARSIADPRRRADLEDVDNRMLAAFRAAVRHETRGRLDATAVEVVALQGALQAHRLAAALMWPWVR